MTFVWSPLFGVCIIHASICATGAYIRSGSLDDRHQSNRVQRDDRDLRSQVVAAGKQNSSVGGALQSKSEPVAALQSLEHLSATVFKKPGLTVEPDFGGAGYHHSGPASEAPEEKPPQKRRHEAVEPRPKATPHEKEVAKPSGGAAAATKTHGDESTAGHGHQEEEHSEGHSEEEHIRAAVGEHGGHGEHTEINEHVLAEFVILPIGLAIIASLFLGAALERAEISWLPESFVTIVIGAFLGGYMSWHMSFLDLFKKEEVFNETCNTLLMIFLLPMLIFEAGWSLRIKDFASQFDYILLFALIGSIISFLVVGSLIYGTGANGLFEIHRIGYARTAFAYASLIAATDPVATLSTYAKLKVDPLLNIMVYGDSTFNDAVAIVLFKVLNNDAIMGTKEQRPSYWQLSGWITSGIFKIFLGSILVGLLCATVFLLAVRFFHMKHAPRLEILAILVVGYMTFAFGEVVGMSGIIATTFCSLMLAVYARPHLSVRGSLLSNYFLKQISTLMDTSVFLLTGFCLANPGHSFSDGAWFGFVVMIFCLIARACSVFPMGFLTNYLKTATARANGIPIENMHLLTTKAMFMMWHAGLRGAISLSLCMQLGGWVDDLDGIGTRHILQTATYWIIVVFLLAFGGSTETCLKKMGIPFGEEAALDHLYKTEMDGNLKKMANWLDTKIFFPLFVGERHAQDRIDESRGLEDVEEVLTNFLEGVNQKFSSPRPVVSNEMVQKLSQRRASVS